MSSPAGAESSDRGLGDRLQQAKALIHVLQEELHAADQGLLALTAELEDRAAAAARAEQRYRSIFDNAAEGILQSTPEGRIILANPAAAEMFGFPSPHSMLSEAGDIRKLYADPAAREEVLHTLRMEGRISGLELRGRRRDGRHIWVRINATSVRNGDGTVVAYEAMLEEVTAQKQAREALEESQERYRSLFRNSPDAIFSCDLDGRITAANPACEWLTGFSTEEMTGRRYPLIVLPSDRAEAEALFATAAGGRPTTGQIALVKRPDEERQARLTFIPAVVRGQITGVYGVAEDLTQQIHLQQQLFQAQKMEAVGQLAGGVAHDFNNLLAVIIGNAELLLEDMAEAEPRGAEDVREIVEAARRGAALTRQLLTFSRRQVVQPRILDVNESIRAMVPMLRRLLREDVELTVEAAGALPPVKIDPTQLEQVILNLVVNARDALGPGGSIRIEAAEVPAPNGQGPQVALRVCDSGSGMSESTVARLFEPFFTTKEEGTGLGLATVHGIVHQNGGTVEVDTAPGEGSCFTVLLPHADGEVSEAVPAGPSEESLRGSGAVLIVEDEPSVRRLTARVLRGAGYDILEAATGAEAVDVARAAARVDLVLTDVVLADRRGWEVVEEVRRERPGVRVLFTSGYAEALPPGFLEKDEAALFLGKPFSPEELLRTVKLLLERQPRS